MARTTKLELEQALIASQRDNHLLREQNSVLRASNEVLRTKLAEAAEDKTTTADWPKAPRAERKLPAHFVAAREAAMRLGRVVRVGA